MKKQVLLVFGVFGIALLLRVFAIQWGLPSALHTFSYHPDETINFGVVNAVNPLHGKFAPGFYNYGTFYFFIVRLISGSGDLDFVGTHMAGRMVSAFAGAGLAAVASLTMLRWTHWVGALCAGLAIAFAPGLVVHSQFFTVDMLATFLFALSIYFALNVIPAPGGAPRGSPLNWAIASGVCAGLATGTKYTGAVALVTLFVAVALSPASFDKGRAYAYGFLSWMFTFIISTPGLILDQRAFGRDFAFEMLHSREGHGLVFAATSPGLIFQFGNLTSGIGLILALMGLAGLAYAALKGKHKWAIALATSFIIYYLFIGFSEVKFMRYSFPLAFGIACGVGWLVGGGHLKKGRYALLVAAGFLGIGGVAGGGLSGTLQDLVTMVRPEARDEAALYIKDKEAGTLGLVKDPWYYTPPIYPLTGMMRGSFKRMDEAMKSASHPTVVRYVPEDPAARQDWDIRLFDLKPDRIVFTNLEAFIDVRFAQTANLPAEYQGELDRFKAFSERLGKEYDREKVFGEDVPTAVEDQMYTRPVVSLWKRKPNL